MKLLAFIVFFSLLAACKPDAKHSGSENPQPVVQSASAPHSQLVDTAASLPDCGADQEGWLVYVKDSSQFKACSSGAWTEVEIKNSSANEGISEQFTCGTSKDFSSSGYLTIHAIFANITKFSNGDYFMTCMTQMANDSKEFLDNVSDSEFFKSSGNDVSSGKIACGTLFILGTYDIKSNEITYADRSNKSDIDVLKCSPY